MREGNRGEGRRSDRDEKREGGGGRRGLDENILTQYRKRLTLRIFVHSH